MKRTASLLVMLALGVFATGCAHVPMADRDIDREAKTFATHPGFANIYIYRHEKYGKTAKIPVLVDGMQVGSTAAKTFIRIQVRPGRHTVISRTKRDAVLNVVTVAGKNYFVWQEIKTGIRRAGSTLHLADDAEGKKRVLQCDLIE